MLSLSVTLSLLSSFALQSPTSPPALAAPSFNRTDYPVGAYPDAIIAADFNGDGILDLAVGNNAGFSPTPGPSTVGILLGNGDGTFRPMVEYGAGNQPLDLAAGDFNGDGKLDMAVANWGAPTVSILLGNGDGTFQPYYTLATPGILYSVVTADFNGDNKLDLVVSNWRMESISVFLGNGNGTFQARVDYLAAGAPQFMNLGDFNGDGKLDLAVADARANVASVFPGNGDGTFAPRIDSPVSSPPNVVSVADLNGDGILDLVAPSQNDTALHILIGYGDGSFQPETRYLIPGTGGQAVGLVDFNGDGHVDLGVALGGGAAAILLGSGDGTFQDPIAYATGASSYSVAVGDFNRDGSPDLAISISSGTVSVLLNAGPPDHQAPSVTCAAADTVWHGTNVSIACTASDTGSGLVNSGDADFSLTTSVALGSANANAQTNPRTICDVAGNCTTAGPIGGNMVDKKAPTISMTAPTNGTYLLNQIAAASFDCADVGSGVSGCQGPVASGSPINTSSVGSHSFSVAATDAVGNAATSSVTYSVGYNQCLLFDPTKSYKAGSTIPIKLQLCDAAGVNVSTASVPVVATAVYLVSTSAPGILADSGNANPDYQFRFTDASYIFNLSLKGFGQGTYALTFTAGGDPTPHAVQFQVR